MFGRISYEVGIVGFGTVGKATAFTLNKNAKVRVYDPKYSPSDGECFRKSVSDLAMCDIVYICTPSSSVQDEQNCTPIIDSINKIEKAKVTEYLANEVKTIYIIRSSVLPSKIQDIFKASKSKNIIFMPEFLNENSSYKDALNEKIICGCDNSILFNEVEDILIHILKKSSDENKLTLVSCKEACEAKYTHNLYSITKILFWEMIQDLTGNSRKMHDLYKLHEVKSDMNLVGLDGYRGAGGKCFPVNINDVSAATDHALIDALKKYNDKLLNQSNNQALVCDQVIVNKLNQHI